MASRILKKLSFSILLLCSSGLLAQVRKQIPVVYNNYDIEIDGKLDDWEEVPANKFRTSSKFTKNPNMCRLAIVWDEVYFYIGIKVNDNYLIALEKPDQIKRLHYNDSFEIYIDSQNDSRDTIDLNDYQFIIEIQGGNTVFRGDRLNLKLKHMVPKAAGIANIVFKAVATYTGTLNNNSDTDSGYIVECRIPWASIGIDPKPGIAFKSDFCINDNDTLVDFHTLPPGPVKNYTNTTMLGYRDFGYPSHWPTVVLEGSPTLFRQLTNKYAKDWAYFLLFSIGSIALAISVFLIKIKRLHEIPNRADDAQVPLVSYIVSPPEQNLAEQKHHPFLDKARNYILQNLDRQITSEDLASELAVSIRQLQRVFQTELDTTPKAFIITVKLEVAAGLLKTPGKNVTEIAYTVGFTDPSYFARVFKKYFSVSPSEFQSK
jgi:AraC-like DNA-binding protein